MELGDKLEKKRFELIQGRIPETLTITDDEDEEELSKNNKKR